MPSTLGRPLTARRLRTRQRLLDAALEAFVDQGFGATTVEQVCERAGFTRGAFYSNFTSLDELFLAMWEQRSTQLLTDLGALLRADQPKPVDTVRDAVGHVLEAIPLDDGWYRVNAEFTAHALRNAGLRRVMAAREEAILATLLPVLEELLARTGRRIVDREALGPALVAVHDGTTVQCLIEDDTAAARARRTDLFILIVEHFTEEITA
jgi:AcrR family transcriptional regulator